MCFGLSKHYHTPKGYLGYQKNGHFLFSLPVKDKTSHRLHCRLELMCDTGLVVKVTSWSHKVSGSSPAMNHC